MMILLRFFVILSLITSCLGHDLPSTELHIDEKGNTNDPNIIFDVSTDSGDGTLVRMFIKSKKGYLNRINYTIKVKGSTLINSSIGMYVKNGKSVGYMCISKELFQKMKLWMVKESENEHEPRLEVDCSKIKIKEG